MFVNARSRRLLLSSAFVFIVLTIVYRYSPSQSPTSFPPPTRVHQNHEAQKQPPSHNDPQPLEPEATTSQLPDTDKVSWQELEEQVDHLPEDMPKTAAYSEHARHSTTQAIQSSKKATKTQTASVSKTSIELPPTAFEELPLRNYSDGEITEIKHLPHDVLQKKVKELIQWEPLGTGPRHWPIWEAYGDKDYDPNRWEGFDWYV